MKQLLPFLLLLVSFTTLAESGAYRIEVIVFRHLNIGSETTDQFSAEVSRNDQENTGAGQETVLVETQALRSFSHIPDFEEPRQAANLLAVPVDVSSNGLADDPATLVRDDLPDDLNIIIQKSPRMNDVWRRLRSSSIYQPLVHAAWEQNRTDYYPPMRIHDHQVIDTQLRPPTHIMVADLAAEDPLAAYRSTFYQLDGSVQLRRSRFLHLFLDLEYRQENPPPGTQSMIDSRINHELFSLKQNRQIRTSTMQYFDTPYMGALVHVSVIRAN
jgi:hypothetical protein